MKLIHEWNERLVKPLPIRILQTADKRTAQFTEFGEILSRQAPKVQILTEEGEGLPALLPAKAWQYHLVPAGAELKPFLELAVMIAQGRGGLPEPGFPSLKAVQRPSRLKIYVTSYCPHCKELVTRVTPLPLFNPLIHITIIDGGLFPEAAAADKVRAVPTLICDDRFRWTGPLRLEELIGVLAERDPSRFGVETFKRMIQEGEVGRLAGMMMENDLIFPGFLETLMHPDFQTRLGAMVVFEDIAERRPALAKQALEPVWEKIDSVDERVRGDMIYLIGKTGSPEWRSRLEAYRSPGLSSEMRGVVEEALESLQQKK
ncbi:MAG: thioredoxin family protein [Thermodesulfobacteriota bacterium]